MKVVIVGGGAIGSSSAYHLATHPRFQGEITVVERDPSYARASSMLSASGIRQQFSTPVSIQMSQYGLGFIRDAARALAVDGDAPLLAFKEHGYLFLSTDSGLLTLRENVDLQRSLGADISLLDPAALSGRFPWLSTDGLAAGAFGERGEGSFDGPAMLQALRRRARSLGVRYVAQEATGFSRAGDAVDGVQLADGSVIPCDAAVVSAGPWSGYVAKRLGVDMPIVPRKRMVYVISCREKLGKCPLVIDPTGIWFRQEGEFFLRGRSPGEGEPDPDEPPLEVTEACSTITSGRCWPSACRHSRRCAFLPRGPATTNSTCSTTTALSAAIRRCRTSCSPPAFPATACSIPRRPAAACRN